MGIRVAVCGAAGRMGQEVVRAVLADGELDLVGACDVARVGEDAGTVAGTGPTGVAIRGTLEDVLAGDAPDVVVDFTHPSAVYGNVLAILEGAHAVVGTTGLAPDQLADIDRFARERGRAAIVCPNFALGAVLMMHFARLAARYFPNVEIVELHHDRKADAPSGTALATARLIAQAREGVPSSFSAPETVDGARGAACEGVRVHSVRLPGLVAHQEVIFGGPGQVLTIRHDSIDRTSFMPGVLLAIRHASDHVGLVYGLERLLGLGETAS